MSYYGFKPNPKQRVINKVVALLGKTVKVKVEGRRLSPLECKQLLVSVDSYLVECFVDEKFLADATDKNWRKAYDKLVLASEEAVKNKVQI